MTGRDRVVAAYKGEFADCVPAYPIAGSFAGCLDGLKLIRRICTTPPMRDYVAGEFLPGEKVASDADWLAFTREMGETVFHPTSTCSMGSVVDSRLKVQGVENLRVVDASVMPAVPSGNINAAVIAVAEKAADLLKE